MRRYAAGIWPIAILLALTGCAGGPSIPDSQLSAEEISQGLDAPVARVETPWVEPLTPDQSAKLDAARRAWSDDNLPLADQLLNEVLQARPDHPDLLANSAIVAWSDGREEQARTLFEETLKVYPGHLVASNNLALLLKEEGEFIEASRILRRALALHPDEPTLHYNLAVVYELYLQDLWKALDHYQKFQALSAEPDTKVAGWITDLERITQ